jgi:hypothetical protein
VPDDDRLRDGDGLPGHGTNVPKAAYAFIDRPRYVAPADYDAAVARMCDTVLLRLPGVRAVYQIGGVSTPGISDLDMVAVFDDDASSTVDPLAGLPAGDRYLFVHALYGCTVSQLPRILRYTAFHNYRHLRGEELPLSAAAGLDAREQQHLKTQIALEFLVRMYVNCVVQEAYRLVKLRGYFLQVKAIRYDLEFLGVEGGALAEVTDELIAARSSWFTRPADDATLARLTAAFLAALGDFLDQALARHVLYLEQERVFTLAPRMTLRPGPRLGCRRRGPRLPAWLGRISPKWINLQNRFNHFDFTVPATAIDLPPSVAGRFELIRDLRAHNAARLPRFATLTSSLNL